MNLGTTVGTQVFAQIRSLFTVLGFLDTRGELAWNATFLCMETSHCVEAVGGSSNPSDPILRSGE